MRTLAPLLLAPLLAASACTPTIDGSKTGGDSGLDIGSDGTDGAEDTGTDGTEEPEPEPDFSVWEGSRTFTVDAAYDDYDCEGDTVAESGVELTDGSAYVAIMELCPLCDHVYEVTVDRDEVCGWVPVNTRVWRGVVLGEGAAQIYGFQESRGSLESFEIDGAAGFDGWTLSYDYVGAEDWWGQIDIVGSVTFPEAE